MEKRTLEPLRVTVRQILAERITEGYMVSLGNCRDYHIPVSYVGFTVPVIVSSMDRGELLAVIDAYQAWGWE